MKDMATLLVLAAGMGSRYGGLKQLDPMGPNGETILDYSVYDAIRAGFDKVVFIIRKSFASEFEERANALYGGKIQIGYCYQEVDNIPAGFDCPAEREKPWGTAHAIWVAKQSVNDPFAVINADDYYGPEGFKTAFDYLSQQTNESSDYGMVAYQLANTLSDHGGVNRGVVKHNGGLLEDVHEVLKIERQKDDSISGVDDDQVEFALQDDTLVSMNFFLFTPSLFGHLDTFLEEFFTARLTEDKSESYIPAVVDELIKSGQATCAVKHSTDQWFGVTYPDDKPIVQAAIANCIEKGVYPAAL